VGGRLGGAALMIVFLTVSSVDAAETVAPRRATVTVRVFNQSGASSHDLGEAMSEAADILQTVGLDLLWLSCGDHDDDPPGCRRPLRPGDLIVRLGSAPSIPTERNVAMGYALVVRDGSPASFATVFDDLVRTVARRAAVDHRRLLGRAIAHEIGHLLLNDNQHGRRGLMRAGWSQAEIRLNRPSGWLFGDDEAFRIRAALTVRTE